MMKEGSPASCTHSSTSLACVQVTEETVGWSEGMFQTFLMFLTRCLENSENNRIHK